MSQYYILAFHPLCPNMLASLIHIIFHIAFHDRMNHLKLVIHTVQYNSYITG